MKRFVRQIAVSASVVTLLAAFTPMPSLPPPLVVEVAGSCAHAAAAAAQQGGQVIGAPQLVERNGRQVCIVTVLIQKPGSPPVRRHIEIPAR